MEWSGGSVVYTDRDGGFLLLGVVVVVVVLGRLGTIPGGWAAGQGRKEGRIFLVYVFTSLGN